MSNKNVAWLGIIGFAVFMVAYLADTEGILYYAGLLAFYVGIIWSWVILFKSDKK